MQMESQMFTISGFNDPTVTTLKFHAIPGQAIKRDKSKVAQMQ
jgi:hypothetical protein